MHTLATIGLICFGPLLLALLVSGKWRDRRAIAFSFATVVAVTVTVASLVLGQQLHLSGRPLAGLQYNWAGKLSSMLATLLVFAALPQELKRETGILTRPHPPRWRGVICVSMGILLGLWVLSLSTDKPRPMDVETLLFQATLPGLDEESNFRGTFLALLIGAFGKPWRIAGVKIGWGAVVIVLWFGLAHGLPHPGASISMRLASVCAMGVFGAGVLWLKERTGSIWVCVAVHNLASVGIGLIEACRVCC
jgi:hypothetical protein